MSDKQVEAYLLARDVLRRVRQTSSGRPLHGHVLRTVGRAGGRPAQG